MGFLGTRLWRGCQCCAGLPPAYSWSSTGGVGAGGPLPCSPQREKGALGGGHGACRMEQSSKDKASARWDRTWAPSQHGMGKGGTGRTPWGQAVALWDQGWDPKSCEVLGSSPKPWCSSCSQVGSRHPKAPQKICAVRAGRWGPGSPRGGLTVVWGPGTLGLLRHLHPCCAKLSSRLELEPAPVCWREEIQERGTSSTRLPPPGTNQGTEGEGTRGGWCEGSSELSLRWRGWGKAQRPPLDPQGSTQHSAKG